MRPTKIHDKIIEMFNNNLSDAVISNDSIMQELGVGIQDLDVEIFVELIAMEGNDILISEDGGLSFMRGANFPEVY